MANYVSSFREGIKAAEIANENKDEIQSVFEDLNNQLSSETERKLQIKIESHYENKLFESITEIVRNKEKNTYETISAFNPLANSVSSQKLARWKMSRHGYPCRIYFDNTELISEDKESLESNLQILLSDPLVGKKLFHLINFEVNDKKKSTDREMS